MTEDLELGELLSSHYGQPLPSAEYHRMLVRRLQVAACAARRRRSWAVGMTAAAACLFLMITAGWWIRAAFDHIPPAAKPAPVAASRLPTNPGGGFAEEIPVVPLIVRARISVWQGTVVEYTVERSIYGALTDKTLKIDALSSDPDSRKQSFDAARSRFIAAQHRNPTDDELLEFLLKERGYVKNREVILFLRPLKDGFEVAGSRFYDLPGSADEAEKNYVQLIRDGNYPPVAASPLPTNPGVAIAPSSGASGQLAYRMPLRLADVGPEQLLSATSLVVRARIESFNGMVVHVTILRPIFGETEAKTLDFDFTGGNAAMLAPFRQFSRDNFIKNNHREPSDAELEAAMLSDRGIVKGAEELLIFQQVAGADGKVELRPKSAYAGGLDNCETQIVDAIQSGSFLDPASLPGDEVTAVLVGEHATAIRATLLKVDDHAATWEVAKMIVGKIAAGTVVIPHDLFRLRAQAMVRHAALDDAALKDPTAFAARVDTEMKKLMTEELTPHRAAILVLTNSRAQGNDTRTDVVERAYEDATHKHLDQVEKVILDSSGNEMRL